MKNDMIRVPDPENLSSVQKIGDLTSPYVFDSEYSRLFTQAMKENISWHAGLSVFYQKVLTQFSYDPKKIQSLKDCHFIPYIPANFFKTHEVISIPKENILMHFTSSGTTGQKSQIFFDDWSFRSGQRMVDSVFQEMGWITPKEKTNYLLYSYETDVNSKLGTAYTDHYLCKYAPINETYPALRRTGDGTHEFDVFGCISKLQQFEKDGLPTRVFGFPAFLYFTLKRMEALETPPLKLRDDSLVFLGGGWKGHANQAVSKPELYSLITKMLGIPDHRIRDSFGAVEHAIPYAECSHHHFHTPVWSQVIIRDVRTLLPCRFGQPGFLQFLTPFITSVPAQSVLMGDLASLFPGKDCPCGISSPYFVVHGRAGTSKNKSCAMAASEMLGK